VGEVVGQPAFEGERVVLERLVELELEAQPRTSPRQFTTLVFPRTSAVPPFVREQLSEHTEPIAVGR
jgi:hypothetical protein